jgi:hypothetical protein
MELYFIVMDFGIGEDIIVREDGSVSPCYKRGVLKPERRTLVPPQLVQDEEAPRYLLEFHAWNSCLLHACLDVFRWKDFQLYSDTSSCATFLFSSLEKVSC